MRERVDLKAFNELTDSEKDNLLYGLRTDNDNQETTITYLFRRVRFLKTTRNLLIGVIITMILATFCNPYEVKVGGVCLSCWGD